MNIKPHFSDETAETLLISANCGGAGSSAHRAAGTVESLQPTGREIKDTTLCPPLRLSNRPAALSTGAVRGCTAAGGSASPSSQQTGSIPALGMGRGAFPASHEMALEPPSPHPEHLQSSSPSQSLQRMRLLPLHQSQRKSVIRWMFTNKRRIWRQIKDDSPDLAQYQVPVLTAFAWVPLLRSVAELGVSRHALIMLF